MHITYRNRFGSVGITQVDRQERCHITGITTTTILIIVPQYTCVIITPTLHAVIIENDTGIHATCGNGFGSVGTTKVDGQERCHITGITTTIDVIVVA